MRRRSVPRSNGLNHLGENRKERAARWAANGDEPDWNDPLDADDYMRTYEQQHRREGLAMARAHERAEKAALHGSAVPTTRRPPAPTARGDQLRDRALSNPTLGQDGAGVVLGLFSTILLLQYLNGGSAGVRRWLAAKFLNRTSSELGVNAVGTGAGNDFGLLAPVGLRGAPATPGSTTYSRGDTPPTTWQGVLGLSQHSATAPVPAGAR